MQFFSIIFEKIFFEQIIRVIHIRLKSGKTLMVAVGCLWRSEDLKQNETHIRLKCIRSCESIFMPINVNHFNSASAEFI